MFLHEVIQTYIFFFFTLHISHFYSFRQFISLDKVWDNKNWNLL
jgi:hypothetical protein